MTTPIQKLCRLSNNNIFIKRDDLLGFSFGGNKIRIAQEFFDDMNKKGADCIIGYGSSKSNLCRAIANMSSSKGIPCHIISPSEDDGTRTSSSNEKLVETCGVTMHYCSKQNVAHTVESVIDECKNAGYNPYYINGDKFGRGNERTPLYAYEKAYKEISHQEIKFDFIFLATGTGMTQSGLILGSKQAGGKEKIVGISIARDSEKEKDVIKNFLKSAGVEDMAEENIIVTDKYLCNGYGKYNKPIADAILNIYRTYGIPLDPTYTGKAFYGMSEYLKENNIQNKNVLFIHTGGTPLFFDFINTYKPEPEIRTCRNADNLLCYLKKIDAHLTTPLSSRTDLKEFSEKVMGCGNVLTIENNGEIVSAILFYANDTVGKNAYITLLGTLPVSRGKGHANALMKEMEKTAKLNGMEKVHLDTDISNTKAIAFYSKNGYKTEAVREKIHMVKEI